MPRDTDSVVEKADQVVAPGVILISEEMGESRDERRCYDQVVHTPDSNFRKGDSRGRLSATLPLLGGGPFLETSKALQI